MNHETKDFFFPQDEIMRSFGKDPPKFKYLQKTPLYNPIGKHPSFHPKQKKTRLNLLAGPLFLSKFNHSIIQTIRT